MQLSFNLIDQAWIPCVTLEGDLSEVSLRDLFRRAPELREIACATPIQSAAVLPLALAVLHRVFGPATLADWKALWNTSAFDMPRLDAYFTQWHERFDLFHPQRPFYLALVKQVKPRSLIHLVHSKGNTKTLFTHETDEDGIDASPAEAASLLITSRHFRTCGAGSSIGKRRTYEKDSPFARGVIFWAKGARLYDTLRLNLMLYTKGRPMDNSEDDAPAWEMDDPFRARSSPLGYLDYLTWSNNRIQLIPQFKDGRLVVREAIVAPAIALSPDVRSPQKCYLRRESRGEVTFRRLDFDADKALWRNYHSLLPQAQAADDPPSKIVAWLSTLVQFRLLARDYPLQLMATGMLVKDNAKVVFYRKEIMPLPPAILQEADHAADIADVLKQAEDIGRALDGALNTLAQHILLRGGGGKTTNKERKGLIQNWHARERYWAELEQRFQSFIHNLINDSDEAKRDWAAALRETALDALTLASKRAGSRPWALKGSIAAERGLFRALKKLVREEVQ